MNPDEIEKEQTKLANQFENGKEVLDAYKKRSLKALRQWRKIIVTFITCAELHPLGRQEEELYSANLTLKLIDNEFRIRELKK